MSKEINENEVWHNATVTRGRREKQGGHRSKILWFTGLSGAGKSTLAHRVEEELYLLGCKTIVLDGDNVRQGLCKDLGFSDQDRAENLRRIGESAKLFIEAGLITLTAFISPFQSARRDVRNMFSSGDFIEIYCKCSLNVCEGRDVKGMYKRAREGQILNFTGISSPYEAPKNPELVVPTGEQTLEESTKTVMRFLRDTRIFTKSRKNSLE